MSSAQGSQRDAVEETSGLTASIPSWGEGREGGGTNAARRSRNSTHERTSCVVPSLQARFSPTMTSLSPSEVFLDSCLHQWRTEQVAAESLQAFTVGGSRPDVRVEVVAVDGRASSRQGLGAPGNPLPSRLSSRTRGSGRLDPPGTAPVCTSVKPISLPRSRNRPKSSRITAWRPPFASTGRQASRKRCLHGKVRTHFRMGLRVGRGRARPQPSRPCADRGSMD
jgi:hypothetical protein